jgi:hypothetical protein
VTRTALALAAVVAAGTITDGSLGGLFRGPSVFADELIYMDATRSIAGGHRPLVRDQTYGRGPLYPILAAPVLAATSNERDGYIALKAFNAFLFSLAAVPIYFLARRVLGRGWSLATAALAIAIPSSLYTGLVVTESIAYLTSSLATLAVVLALERPTARRQLAALGAAALAGLARPQLVAIAVAFVIGLGVRWLVLPPTARPGLRALRRLWPGAAAAGAAALVVVAALASGHATLGDYRDVWTSYSPLTVARWSWYTLGGLALYLAVIPFVLAPAALADLARRGRAGSTLDASLLGAFVGVNAVTVVIVAAFSGASFGFERLHDRYLFYVVPLWLVVVVLWLGRGARASWRELVVGGGISIILLATLPNRLFVHDGAVQFDGIATALWSRVRDLNVERTDAFRLVLVTAGLAAACAVVGGVVVRRVGPALLAPMVAIFAINAAIVWDARVADARRDVFADNSPATWSWIDHALPGGASVTELYVDSGCVFKTRDEFRWTEFFNERIGPVIRVGLPPPPGVVTDGADVRIDRSGIVRGTDGRALRPEYVVADPGLEFAGRRIATGTVEDLPLWHVDRPLRVLNARSNRQALEAVCPGAPA